MAKDVEVEIFLKGGKEFERDIKKTGKATEKAAEGFSKGQASLVTLSAAFSLVTSAARGALRVVGVLTDIGAAAIKTGSDFEEAQQKFSVVFAGVAEESRTMRDELAKNFGLSSLAATELLSTTGDLLTGFGFTDKAALGLSETVNKLAVDIASFSNIEGGAERASNILTKALLGEREGLKSLGIAVLEVDVKQRLLLKGQQDLEGAALRQAKAVATLELAYEQSGKAIGDFQRSQESLANQQRILNARLTDLETILGQALVPITKVFVSNLINITNNTLAWVEANKDLIASGLVDFARVLNDTFTFLATSSARVAQLFLTFKAAGEVAASGFTFLQTIALEAFAGVSNGLASLIEGLTNAFDAPLEAIKAEFLRFLDFVETIVINAESILPASTVAGVKANLKSIQDALAEASPEDEGAEGEDSLSKRLRANAKEAKIAANSLRGFGVEQLKGAESTAIQVAQLEFLIAKIEAAGDAVDENLAEVGRAADNGTLFEQSLQNLDAQNEAEQAAAAERAALFAAEQEEKRLAVQAFNEFVSQSEEGQIEAAEERKQRRLEGLEQESQSNIDIALNEAALRLEIETSASEEIFEIREKFRTKDADAEKRQADAKRKRDAQEASVKFQTTAALLGGLSQLSASFGEDNFKTTKALRIGEAVINTYAGANLAYAEYGWPYGAVAAAAVIAAGLANVNTIRQQKPTRAQQGLGLVQRAEEPALLHLGETVLTRDQTGILADFLQERNTAPTSAEATGGGNGVSVNLNVENFTLMSDDDEAIGELTTAIRRQLEEQNLVAIQ